MIDKRNLDIHHLLEHAEITDELYSSLISYTPSQHHSAYEWSFFPTEILTTVYNMVSALHIYAVLITPPCFLKESAELRNPEESSRNASQLARDSMEFLRNAKGFLKD